MARKSKKKGPGRYSERNRHVPSRKQRRKWQNHGRGVSPNARDTRINDFDLDEFMERMRRGEIV